MIQIPISLFAVNYCSRLRFNFYSSINHTIRKYNNVSDNEKRNFSKIMKSIKYPDYNVIYTFPYIVPVFILNKIKRNITILCGITIPTTTALQILNIIPLAENVLALSGSCILTFALHIGCYACNNLIGSIYFNEEKQKVIISYVNYWGNRIDFKTDTSSVTPITESPTNYNNNIYRFLIVKSCKHKLKLFHKHGNIINQSNFNKVLGNVN